ncbi:BA75_02251T0 [Komagataella pastoris]|uniref:Spindle pole body component n=1 Tax=Komagataella pastoris TaxID=4922 RepID=A0A1B2JCB7_PICPA|nr:BA75_02251T0 [Komagataella pastoris]
MPMPFQDPKTEGLLERLADCCKLDSLIMDKIFVEGSRIPVLHSVDINDFNRVMDQFRERLVYKQREIGKWNQFQHIVNSILKIEKREVLVSYLSKMFQAINSTDTQEHNSDLILDDTSPYRFHKTSFSDRDKSLIDESTEIKEPAAQYTNKPNKRVNTKTIRPLAAVIQQYSLGRVLEESQLIQYLQFTLLGNTSQIFPLIEDGIQLPSELNHGMARLLHKIVEPALLYRYLSKVIHDNEVHCHHISQAKVAFLSQVSRELKRYTKIINNLFLNIDELTLARIYFELKDETIRLRTFYNFIRFLNLATHAFLSQLQEFTKFGDVLIRDPASEVFTISAAPYYQLIRDWLAQEEFNISRYQAEGLFVLTRPDPWNEDKLDFVLDKEKLPTFIDPDLCEKIFQIGKMIIFLKREVRDLQWVNQYSNKLHSLFSGEMDSTDFKSFIDYEYQQVSEHLSHIVYNELDFQRYLQVLHGFLLAGNGEFIESLMSFGKNMLDRNVTSITSRDLAELLQKCISLSEIEEKYIQGLDARLLDLDQRRGWESFTLDYVIDGPLSIILGDLKEYLRMFNFLWRLHSLNFELREGWKTMSFLKKGLLHGCYKDLRKLKVLRRKDKFFVLSLHDQKLLMVDRLLRKVNVIRNLFIKFSEKVISFFKLLIIDANYQRLQQLFNGKTDEHNEMSWNGVLLPDDEYLETASVSFAPGSMSNESHTVYNLDEFVELHRNYISSISRHKFVNTEGDLSKGKISGHYFIHQLNNLTEFVAKFVIVNQEISHNIVELLNTQDEEYYKVSQHRLSTLTNTLQTEIIEQFSQKLRVLTDDLIRDDDMELRFFGLVLES